MGNVYTLSKFKRAASGRTRKKKENLNAFKFEKGRGTIRKFFRYEAVGLEEIRGFSLRKLVGDPFC